MHNSPLDHVSAEVLNYPRGHHDGIRATVHHIEKLNKLGVLVERQFGKDAKQRVLQYEEVEYALKKILDYHTNIHSTLPDESFKIYNFFVTHKLKYAESVLES